MDVDGRGHAQGGAPHHTRQSAASRHEPMSSPIPMPPAPLTARHGLAHVGPTPHGMSQAPLPQAVLASLRGPAEADGALPALRSDAWFTPLVGGEVPRIRVSDLEPRDGVPSASYLRAVETFSAALSSQGAAVLEPSPEDSVLFQCALESAQLFFQRTGGSVTPEESVAFRAGESLCGGDTCVPPSADRVFSRMGGIARIALAAVARGLVLPQESVLGSVDSCPLQLGEVSSSILSVSALHYQQTPSGPHLGQQAVMGKPLRKSGSRARKADPDGVKSPSTASASEADEGTPKASTAAAAGPEATLRSPEANSLGAGDAVDEPQIKEEPAGGSRHGGIEGDAGGESAGAASAAETGFSGLRAAEGDTGATASADIRIAEPELSPSPPRQATKAAPVPELTPPGLLLLIAADSPGLEVKDKQGHWKCVDKGLPPGSVLVLLGERLSQASASNCPAALYRVAGPFSPAEPWSPSGPKPGVPGKIRDWRSHFFSRHALAFHLMPRGSTAESESLGAASALATHSSLADPESFAQPQTSVLMNASSSALPSASAASLAAVLKDPLSGNLMEDAMVAPCGHTFGGEALRRIMDTMLCVYCKQPLGPLQLVPNLVVRAVVAVLKRSKAMPFPSGASPAVRNHGSPTLPFRAKKHHKKSAVAPSQGSLGPLGLGPDDAEETTGDGVPGSRGGKAADALSPNPDSSKGPSAERAGAAVEASLRGPDEDEEDGDEDEEELPIGERGAGLAPTMRQGWGPGGLKAVKRRKDKDGAPLVVARDGGAGSSLGKEEKQGDGGADVIGGLRLPVKKALAAGFKPKTVRPFGAGATVGSGSEPGSSPFSPEREGGSGGAAGSSARLKGVQFPFSVNDRVLIKGNKRTPEKFVGREAVITSQCLNGWYLVRTLDTGESVRLQYRSLQRSDRGPFLDGALSDAPRPARSVGLPGSERVPKQFALLPAPRPRDVSPSAAGPFPRLPVFPSLAAPLSLPPRYAHQQQGGSLGAFAAAAVPASLLEAGLQCDSEELGPEAPVEARTWLEDKDVEAECAGEALGVDALRGMRLGQVPPDEQGEGESQGAEDAAALTLSMFPSAIGASPNQSGPLLLPGAARWIVSDAAENGAGGGLVELSLAVAAMGRDLGPGLWSSGAALEEGNPAGAKMGMGKGARTFAAAASASKTGLLSLRLDHDRDAPDALPGRATQAATDAEAPRSPGGGADAAGRVSAGQEENLIQDPQQQGGEERDEPQSPRRAQSREGPLSLKLKLLGKGPKSRPPVQGQEGQHVPFFLRPPQRPLSPRGNDAASMAEAGCARASSPPHSTMMPPKKRDFAVLMGKAGSSSISAALPPPHHGPLHEAGDMLAAGLAAGFAAPGGRGLAAAPPLGCQEELIGKALREADSLGQKPKRQKPAGDEPEPPARPAAAGMVPFGIGGKAPGTCASDQDASTGPVMRSAHVQVQCPDESA